MVASDAKRLGYVDIDLQVMFKGGQGGREMRLEFGAVVHATDLLRSPPVAPVSRKRKSASMTGNRIEIDWPWT